MKTPRDPAFTDATSAERDAEFERLQREHYGDALDAPMAVVARVIDRTTGRVLREWGDGSPRVRHPQPHSDL